MDIQFNNLRQEIIKLKAAEIISDKNSIHTESWYTSSVNLTEFEIIDSKLHWQKNSFSLEKFDVHFW